MWVLFLRPFPGKEAHKLFSGVPNGVFWVGDEKFMSKKLMCFFGPLALASNCPCPNCLLKCFPHCLSRMGGFIPLLKAPAMRVIARQTSRNNCLVASFALWHWMPFRASASSLILLKSFLFWQMYVLTFSL